MKALGERDNGFHLTDSQLHDRQVFLARTETRYVEEEMIAAGADDTPDAVLFPAPLTELVNVLRAMVRQRIDLLELSSHDDAKLLGMGFVQQMQLAHRSGSYLPGQKILLSAGTIEPLSTAVFCAYIVSSHE